MDTAPDHDGTPYELSETMRAGVAEHTVYMELSLRGDNVCAKGSE